MNGGSAIETAEGGYYFEPTVIVDVAPTARIAQEEVFGPVLAVIRSSSVDEALTIANGTEYGLTGAIYSSSSDTLDRAAEEFQVGNLYLNRKCTGAMVGAHPFGGFNMSELIRRQAARIICCCLRRRSQWQKRSALLHPRRQWKRSGWEFSSRPSAVRQPRQLHRAPCSNRPTTLQRGSGRFLLNQVTSSGSGVSQNPVVERKEGEFETV